MKRLTIALCLMIAACCACQTVDKGQEQWESLSSVERAMRLDAEFLKALNDLKDSIDRQYQAYVEVGDQEGIDFIEQDIAPLVADVEAAISVYHKLVLQWAETGVPPSDVEMAAQAVIRTLDFIEMRLMERALGR